MNLKSFFTPLLSFCIMLNSCKKEQKQENPIGEKPSIEAAQTLATHNSANSLDWDGTYTGTVPCADCEGIETKLTLNKDMTYTLYTTYLGKSSDINELKGTFTWNDAGNTVMISGVENGPSQYFVGENTLAQLDMNGNKITGDLAANYILKKLVQATDPALTDKKWELVELMGKPIAEWGNTQKTPFIMLKGTENTINGTGGCNNFGGTYELKEGNRVKFSKLASTMMACPNMSVENELMKLLEMVDNYSIADHKLSLNKARMAPLARFEAVTE